MSNEIIIKPNGPLIARGNIRLQDNDGNLLAEGEEFFLCRCGHSGNKPFCDGSHKQAGFVDAAEIHDEKQEPAQGDEGLVITVRPGAMYIAKGPMTLADTGGQWHSSRNKAALCRCGQSNNKPFCDASHKTAWQDDD